MTTLPTDRTESSTAAEHVSDHNILHALNNDLDDHLAGSDPHTGYQLESEKNQANGYAGLDANVRVPTARLGSGTADGTVFLRGDQTWAAPGGSSVPLLGRVAPLQATSTNKYGRPGWVSFNSPAGTGTLTAGELQFVPIYVAETATFDRIAMEVTAAGAAGTLCRLGIYNMDSAGLPSTLVVDGGTVSVASTGAKEVTISQSLTGGAFYYIAGVSDASPTVRTPGSSDPLSFFMTARGNNLLQFMNLTPKVTGRSADVAGGLPSSAPALTSAGSSGQSRLMFFLRYA